MRVPISWLREFVALPTDLSSRGIADKLVALGLEVETVDEVGRDISGQVVLGRVVDFSEEEHTNGKTVRWCRVDVGPNHNEPGEAGAAAGRGIVCGARNFAVGDMVVVALPGATLPGDFAISARKTYGHISDGMICSTRELGTGDDHDGIWVLPADIGKPGDDAVAVLGLREDVLDIAVTPDRGYCLSVRGVAREAALAYGLPFADPAVVPLPVENSDDWPVLISDPAGCDRFVARSVTGFSSAVSPLWMQRRLSLSGMRPISLAVDITNYVMLEFGQPLHAYDRSELQGIIVVRRATSGEVLTTLDGSKPELSSKDLLITDESGPIGIAGVMGGVSTEISESTTDIVIEAAHFDPDTVSRSARLHRLPSEASRRFSRGVDNRLQEAAAERAASLLCEYGGATLLQGRTVVDHTSSPAPITFDTELPTRLVGYDYPSNEVVQTLTSIGCQLPQTAIAGSIEHHTVDVTPPSWRPDLTLPADLVEEVARVAGYELIPSLLPSAPAGGGLTESQRLRRRIGMALAGAGFVEVLSYPFLSSDIHDRLGLPRDDRRRNALRVANPLSDEEPELRTSLLPGLLATLRRNVGRGFDDLAIFEVGCVYRPTSNNALATGEAVPRPSVNGRPSDSELAELDNLLPHQPLRVAVALAGSREPSGWWGKGREARWSDAIEAAQLVGAAGHLEVRPQADDHAPWHPGRCAALYVNDELVGHAGELHPRVVAELGLPLRTCAMELEVSLLESHQWTEPIPAPNISPYPVAKEDVSLIVPESVTAAEVAAALSEGGGDLVESVRLFDVFVGEQIGSGHRSLAFSLRLRAPDRTLAPDQVASTRDAAIAEAVRRTGAVLRS